MTSVRILAPAKVNLGLAILGKRPDGYHEIDTIMAMVELCDGITISPSSDPGISISGMDDIPVESNLMTRAAHLWSDAAGEDAAWHIEIKKAIPSPAGLGGGSSDAAAVLKALNALHNEPLSMNLLHRIASKIGSDCPFFLGAPAARATGIGADLQPLHPPGGWIVLAIAPVADTAKTATLYGSLTPDDYGSSVIIDEIQSRGVHSTELPNSFLHPARASFPELVFILQAITDVTGRAMLSGAGPAVYSTSPSRAEARGWADKLREILPENVQVIAVPFLQSRLEPELLP